MSIRLCDKFFFVLHSLISYISLKQCSAVAQTQCWGQCKWAPINSINFAFPFGDNSGRWQFIYDSFAFLCDCVHCAIGSRWQRPRLPFKRKAKVKWEKGRKKTLSLVSISSFTKICLFFYLADVGGSEDKCVKLLCWREINKTLIDWFN